MFLACPTHLPKLKPKLQRPVLCDQHCCFTSILHFSSTDSHISPSAPPAPPDVLTHTACNLSQEGGGSPAAPPASLFQTGLSLAHLPLTHSLTLPMSLTLSVFPAHVYSDADGSGGVCISPSSAGGGV